MIDEKGKEGRLAAAANLAPGTAGSPEWIDLRNSSGSPWPLEEVSRTGAASTVTGIANLLFRLNRGPYPEAPDTAVVLPIVIAGMDHPASCLIVGISPRLPFTEEYQAFVDLVGATLTAAIVNARAYEEERKRAEKLAELDRAKTAFFSNVSHEFRTPLTLMLGPLEELLAQPDEQFTAKREAIDLVHRNGLRLLRLVNTLLDFSRIEANRVQAFYEPVDIAAFTSDLAGLFRAAVEKAGLALEVHCPPVSEPLYVDREMWEKIILNLLSNAFKFTFHGAIRIELQESAGDIHVSVADTGTGIPEHELLDLFKRFHRVQGAQGRTYEGTGIGLALVEDLVKLHGGKVWAESKLGVGTTFHLRIPKGFEHLPAEQVSRHFKADGTARTGTMFVEEALRWLPVNPPKAVVPVTTKPSNGYTRRILLADDNADMRQYIENILSPEFEIESVDDGAKALEAIKSRRPDLVLTDVMMPELDGFGLLKALRGNQPTRGIPIIMLSARAGEEARVEGLEAGADDYLVKPFNARELVARVRVNLELAHLREELSREEEKRRGAEETERQWRLFDTALSHTPDSIYIFDLQGRLTYANHALLRRWGKSFPDAAGKDLVELGYVPEMAAKLQSQVQQVIQQRTPIRDEISFPDETGGVRYHDYVFVPVLSKSGAVEAVAGSTRDITEFRETNRALQEANNDLQQFAYSASHDLQEPLRMVALYSQLLGKKYKGRLDAQADTIIKQCVEGAVRMEEMIKDLLAYTRASVAPIEPPPRVSLNQSFNSALEALQAGIRETNAFITCAPLPALKVEAVHLRQVFQNLVGNAIKYRSERSPIIHVDVRREAQEWVISVADNGIGISPDYKDQIFGLFKRLHHREQYAGTGLGLAICKKLVERYGGRIWVESEPGKGSIFFFSLPAEDEPDLFSHAVQEGGLECSTV